ncbi:hypothetical protein L2E82_05191 [Cichorium intybus]|uniref:Uncharacterized protein n=1 Tax=Cichorium intybus TaxID=13427 RepID=A0ACB9H6R8_CICIN|nr:hypothetical protein L2E82_05191 [Cichorium intybus]
MAVGGAAANHALEKTPTWALATVCFVFIFLGLVIEHLFHIASRWLRDGRKTALNEALEKLKGGLRGRAANADGHANADQPLTHY